MHNDNASPQPALHPQSCQAQKASSDKPAEEAQYPEYLQKGRKIYLGIVSDTIAGGYFVIMQIDVTVDAVQS